MKWVFSNIISLPSQKSVEFEISRIDFFEEKAFLSEIWYSIQKNLE
ncbi:hypothetical protein LEP1GSC021_4154 [Leptospira noguchii str. 1993005606]|uniref:Uncharacterized protein n=1 Tax=Leptospira noguchii serovar Autumnalis str. ZUN142 TaxID=1085540 RepID=M6UE00_9LEPT|nr:hypothetical protein LEP1GSC186_4689 [Leptospira noguchii serovar Autumnalis str. ZUN142]EMS82855.1 hypothetical protein LEP1GSC074_3444 [Leptospira noguchii str. Hook]EPE82005.1 hypothetical protein LEP1GSC021_4154 [Leptospira noguchii str. 1993005606]